MIYQPAEQTQRAKEIFLDALPLIEPDELGDTLGAGGPERADVDHEAFERLLDHRCGDDAELRRAVRDLLKAHQTPDAMLDGVDDSQHHLPSPQPLTVGQIVGRYRVEELVGEGGMGLVYRAQQSRPIDRTVALKMLKPGLDTRELLGRFRIEQQALARLEHPHIARVLDAGQTDRGHSFFVMEFVDGVPLTTYCDRHRLDLPARLGLFRSLCAAVAFAHQKGILHRDLKPNNVLVSEQHGEPVVKVIDFGLAKAIDGSLDDQTRITRPRHVVGTPPYMSPEQANPNGDGIDTRADVYALGIILRELLTGIRPSESQTTASDNDVPSPGRPIPFSAGRPSRALARLPAPRQSEVAASRSTDPKRLVHSLRGDLDWIVLKATANERERRYDTVATLARDIERSLHDEPIEARPPSRWYECSKWVRRHRAVSAAILTVVLAILLVAGVSLHQARSARQAQLDIGRALERANRAQAASRSLLYASDIRLSAQALERGDVGEAVELLERHQPTVDESPESTIDPRGFEWSYLMRQVKQDRQVFRLSSGALHDLVVGPDGRQIAVAGEGPTVYRIDGESRERIASLRTGIQDINALAYSPTGGRLAVGGQDGAVEVRTLEDKSLVEGTSSLAGSFSSGPQRVEDLLFTPDGTELIVSGGTPEVGVFDWRSGQRLAMLDAHEGTIGSVAISPDGTWLACGSSDSTFTVWRWQDEKLVHHSQPSNGRITAVEFSPDGRYLFDSSVKGHLRVTATEGWRSLGEADVPSAVETIACSPDSRQLGVGCRTGILHRFRLDAAGEPGASPNPTEILRFVDAVQIHESRIHGLVWLNERQAVTASGDGSLVLTRREPDQTSQPSDAPSANAIAVSPDGHQIATHNYQRVQLLNLATGEVVPVEDLHTETNFAGIRFTPNGDALLVATADGKIATVEIGNTLGVKWRDASLSADFTSLRFSADGRRLMLFSRKDSVVIVVEYPSWESCFQTDCPDAYTGSLSSEGRYLATSFRGDVKVYEVDSGELVAESPGHHQETITEVRFGPADEWIATTSDDRTVKLWNPWDGSEPVLIGVHPEGVPRNLAVSSDGRTLLTDSRSGTLWVWSVPARQRLFPIAESPKGFVKSELSANDRTLAYVESGGNLRWIELP